MQLDGKVALVTGADSGIGKAAAIRFAKAGARVAALDLKRDKVEQTVREIMLVGGFSIGLAADISEEAQVQDAIARIDEVFGRLDVVFANAGINGVWAPLEELTVAEWDRTLAVNLRGTFLTVRCGLPLLRRAGGSVIVTSSVNGNRVFSNTGATAYSCSKAAQVAFVKMTAVELARDGIRVNAICPGAISTSLGEWTEQRDVEKVKIPVEFPEGEIPLTGDEPGRADQVAQLALFLASDASSHVTGTEIYIDGAQPLLQG